MTYQGHVKNGTVVLDSPEDLPEGVKVEVSLVDNEESPGGSKPLWMRIVEMGASVPREDWRDVPPDSSINLDHYLYGVAKIEE